MHLFNLQNLPKNTSIKGYKVFACSNSHYYSPLMFYYYNKSSNLCLSHYKDKSFSFILNPNTKEKYVSGFHMCGSIDGAESWMLSIKTMIKNSTYEIWEVELSDLIIKGLCKTDDLIVPCFVGKHLKIIKKVPDKQIQVGDPICLKII